MVSGVTYRKVDRDAQLGDIIRFNDNDLPDYVYDGAFYGVSSIDDRGNPRIKDEDGDSYNTAGDSFEVYAPISEPAAETPTDTITFQGATWRKVDRDVREGDAIKFTDESLPSYLTGAELYVVDSVDSWNDPQITDDDGDSYDACARDYEVYEKVTDSAAVEYREVKRKAAVGERIKIVAAYKSGGRYGNGEEHTVTDADRWNNGGAVTVDGINHAICHSEYVVLEPVTAEPTKPERLKVGEYARVVGPNDNSNDYTIGEIVEIVNDWELHYAKPDTYITKAKRADGSTGNYLREYQVVRATDEEVAAAKRAALIAQFSVGDSVRLTVEDGKRPRFGYGSVSNGDIGKVSLTFSDCIGVNFPERHGWMADPTELTKLTAEEVAEIERKQAEEKRWAAIGRKVNEYKRGDIVKFIRSDRYNALTPGDVGTVVRKDSDGDLRVNTQNVTDGNWFKPSQITLIVPVEQRFDTKEVDAA
jgi:ribosomal protein L21E